MIAPGALPGILARFSQGPEQVFIHGASWLIRRDLLGVFPFARKELKCIPGLPARRKTGIWALRRLFPSSTCRLPLPFDALQLNGNFTRVRGFDIAARLTFKTVRRGDRYGDNTLRELALRTGDGKRLLAQAGLKVPAILGSETDDDYIGFSEEMLLGRTFRTWRDSGAFLPEVALPLMRLYESQGVHDRPLSDILGGNAQKIMDSPRGHPVMDAARRLLENNPQLATTRNHGDLLASNMIVTRSGIYVIDWEKSMEHYAGYDFMRLALKYPSNRHLAQAAHMTLDRFQKGRLSFADARSLHQALFLVRRGFATGRPT